MVGAERELHARKPQQAGPGEPERESPVAQQVGVEVGRVGTFACSGWLPLQRELRVEGVAARVSKVPAVGSPSTRRRCRWVHVGQLAVLREIGRVTDVVKSIRSLIA